MSELKCSHIAGQYCQACSNSIKPHQIHYIPVANQNLIPKYGNGQQQQQIYSPVPMPGAVPSTMGQTYVNPPVYIYSPVINSYQKSTGTYNVGHPNYNLSAPVHNNTPNSTMHTPVTPSNQGPVNPAIHSHVNPVHGSVNPAIHGPVNPAIHGSVNPAIHGSVNPVHGPVAPSNHGSVKPVHSPVNPSIHSVNLSSNIAMAPIQTAPVKRASHSSTPVLPASNIPPGVIHTAPASSTTPKPLIEEEQEIITPTDKRYLPSYRRFRWHFWWENRGKLILFDLQTTHKLNKAMERQQSNVKITIDGKKYIFDLVQMKQFKENEPGDPGSMIIKKERTQLWFYRDQYGVIKSYDIETVARITKELHSPNPKPTIEVKIGKHEYCINIVEKIQKNIQTDTAREVFSESDLIKMRTWTIDFDNIPNPVPPKEASVVQLDPKSDEYKRIFNYFYVHMPTKVKVKVTSFSSFSQKFRLGANKITKIEKIYNPKLRDQWNFLLKKIARDNNNTNPDIPLTKLLWHGSGTLPPPVIYEDVHYGWKINYSSQKNLWGPGLYFGEDASYCHKYTYVNSEGRRQVFLAEVITGDDIISLEDDTIKEPWLKEDGKTRYDSVCGVRHDTSWIWVVYASGRAYPTYLVEYED